MFPWPEIKTGLSIYKKTFPIDKTWISLDAFLYNTYVDCENVIPIIVSKYIIVLVCPIFNILGGVYHNL